MWNIIKSNQSMIYVETVTKKRDINYVREIFVAFVSRVYSIEKHGGKLIINERS